VTGKNDFPLWKVFLNLVPGKSKTSDGEFPRLPPTNTTLILKASDRARFATHAHW
jgi:hypothetical protein